ncbi:DUF3307 domain-containing protein [Ferrovibrio terrae]|uniref:DUF3307 domain-containing protein n=1 Tax=Ferrovibrio terrae TaxID=2594003 RepID=UPI003137BBF3
MTTDLVLWIILALTVKHFICDFPLQATPWMYRNKGTYGHPGGLMHAAIHMLGTAIALRLLLPESTTIFLCVLADFVAHYHIDWAKMRLNAHWKLGPTTSEGFWILLGVDQLLHGLTYIAIVWALTQ